MCDSFDFLLINDEGKRIRTFCSVFELSTRPCIIPVLFDFLDFFEETRVLSFLAGLKDLDLPRPMVKGKFSPTRVTNNLENKVTYQTAAAATQICSCQNLRE
jgi:hypothetical protein